MFLFLYCLGMLASFAFFSYMKGHADARFRDNPGLTENPPFIIGMATCWAWPVQFVGGLLWMLYHVCYGTGKGSGLAVNEELHSLRSFAKDYDDQFRKTLAVLTSHQIDPANIDDNTIRALTARSIEWNMEEDAAQRREQNGLVLVKADPTRSIERDDALFEILDSRGYKVPEDYAERTRGELDL